MYGFSLVKSKYLPSIKSEVSLYTHSSGARLLFAKNDDKNAVVMPVFNTLPTDNKGTAHIVEHCTLCGSEKYPLKDPFKLLEKGSIYTYLNCITYMDKTIYPVASNYEDELYKMAEVYADGVFKPLMLKDEGIFQQEGIHYGENGFNGVVLNEMEGAFADESLCLKAALDAKLYKGCGYEFYSGGVPEEIKALTYEEFKDFYHSHYHPSNCLVYIYGDVDIEKYMRLYNRYFKEYEADFQSNMESESCNSPAKACKSNTFDCNFSGNKSSRSVNLKYRNNNATAFCTNKKSPVVIVNKPTEPIAIKKTNSRNISAVAFHCGDVRDCKKISALSYLFKLVAGDKVSPLYKELVDSGKAKSLSLSFERSAFTATAYIYAEGTKVDTLKSALENVLNNIYKNEIDYTRLESLISKEKFFLKKADFGYKPYGLYMGLILIDGFIYNNEDFGIGDFEGIYNYVRNADYKALIKEYLLDKGQYAYCTESKEKIIKAEINSALINDKPLNALRNKRDNPNDLKLIKAFDYRVLDPKPKWVDYTKTDSCYFIEEKDSDIVYLDLIYPVTLNSTEVSVYAGTLQQMKEGFMEKAEKYFGNIAVNTFMTNKGGTRLVLLISAAFLKENTEVCTQLLKELTDDYNPKEQKLKSLSRELLTSKKTALNTMGHSFGINLTLSKLNPYYYYCDLCSGLAYIDRLEKGITTEDLIKTADFVNKTKPMAVIQGDKKSMEHITSRLKTTHVLPDYKDIPKVPDLKKGYIINTGVNYVTAAISLGNLRGEMRLASDIITNNILWDRVRTLGGAYDSRCYFEPNGILCMYSYRDPQVEKTLEVFKNIGKGLAEFKPTKEELEGLKAGSLKAVFTPDKQHKRHLALMTNLLGEYTYEYKERLLSQQAAATLEDINSIGERLIKGEFAYSVFGGKRVIEALGEDNCISLL